VLCRETTVLQSSFLNVVTENASHEFYILCVTTLLQGDFITGQGLIYPIGEFLWCPISISNGEESSTPDGAPVNRNDKTGLDFESTSSRQFPNATQRNRLILSQATKVSYLIHQMSLLKIPRFLSNLCYQIIDFANLGYLKTKYKLLSVDPPKYISIEKIIIKNSNVTKIFFKNRYKFVSLFGISSAIAIFWPKEADKYPIITSAPFSPAVITKTKENKPL